MKCFVRLSLLLWLTLALTVTPAAAASFTGTIVGTAIHGTAEFWQFYAPGETWTLQYTFDADGAPAPGVYAVELTPVGGQAPYIDPAATPTVTVGRGGAVTGVQYGALGSPYLLIGLGWSFDRFGGGTLEIARPHRVVVGSPVLLAGVVSEAVSVPEAGTETWFSLLLALMTLRWIRRGSAR